LLLPQNSTGFSALSSLATGERDKYGNITANSKASEHYAAIIGMSQIGKVAANKLGRVI